ncbi:MAG: TIGR04282 family arsenosugar biosynthesis glycosyltransferase [Cecembia sp.]
MKPAKNAIIVFQKNAAKGKVKTRIAKDLGEEKALEIYQYLVNSTHQVLSQLKGQDVFLFFSDYTEKVSWQPQEGTLQLRLQKGKDLGEKMRLAFEEVFSEGYSKVSIIGTDCPDINIKILNDAMEKLEEYEVVFGPAQDGGYYLLGLKKIHKGLFDGIPWSTEQVLKLSLDYLNSKQISYELITILSDIDTAEDWENYLR